ncbi:MAG: hypothetical protein JSS72_07790 [Armatimonadetes bacterium]|nr:hypothetical protein [Armatimonadota bacterium]
MTQLLALFSILTAFPAQRMALDSTKGLTMIGTAEMSSTTYRGKKAIMAVNTDLNGIGLILIPNCTFQDGSLDVDVAAKPCKGARPDARGFGGLAWRVTAETPKFEYFYIRATNGRAENQVLRNHAVQYAAHPDFPFQVLRKQSPETYEAYTDLEVGEWTHLHVEVKGLEAKFYVGHASQPCLVVHDLKLGNTSGQVGLWIGPESEAYFANLEVKAK